MIKVYKWIGHRPVAKDQFFTLFALPLVPFERNAEDRFVLCQPADLFNLKPIIIHRLHQHERDCRLEIKGRSIFRVVIKIQIVIANFLQLREICPQRVEPHPDAREVHLDHRRPVQHIRYNAIEFWQIFIGHFCLSKPLPQLRFPSAARRGSSCVDLISLHHPSDHFFKKAFVARIGQARKGN